MSIEAMKLALEALEKSKAALAEELSAWDIDPPLRHVLEAHDLCEPAITALRAAIEQAEKQEPVAWVCNHYEAGVKNDVDYWQDDIDALPVGTPLYTTPPAAQPEQKQDSTCNKTLRAEGKGYPRTCRKCGKGPCIADRVQPEQGQWDAIPDDFNEWWNADYDDSTNPFRLNSPAYWAWSGWSAANKEKNT